MFTRFKILALSLGMLLFLSGCGDLLGSKAVKKELGSGQFEVNCDLDMNAFSNILRKNISRQIRCLGENLNLFIKIVKSGKPGYLSRVQLEHYLATRPDVKPELIKMLSSVFELGHLITGEDPNYISKAVVEKVINFALVFNQEAALNFSPIFENKTPISYALHQSQREIVSGANKAIIQSLRAIFNSNRGGEIHKINIVDLLENFKTEENAESIENAKKVLFAKKLILGGEPEYLTHTELEKLILNFDHFILITLDAVRYQYIILKQDSLLQFLKRDVEDLYKIVLQGGLHSSQDDSKTLFSMDQVLDALKVFISQDSFDIDKYRILIEEAKSLLMTGNAEEIKVGEFKKLFGHALSLLQSGTVFHRIYDKFRVQLENSNPVTIDFSEYRHTYPEHQRELDQFERIVKKYRFMKGEFLSPYYTRAYRRNADAVFEIALLEYALKLVFIKYGSPSPNADAVGGYSIDATQVEDLVLKFEDVLIDMDILTPQKAINTANNISLLGSLFQYQSDKNKVMDINEGTEFALTLFSAMPMSDEIFDMMKADPACSVDEFDRVDPDCFKRNYWKSLCSGYRGYYPLLFDSLGAPASCNEWVNSVDNELFLDKLSNAARTCNYYDEGKQEEIPYSKSDIMTILVAMTHVETTILRWDINNNNIMDASEVNSAYEIYSPALDGFLEGQSPIIKKFKKQIFQFLVKYEEIPDPKEFKSIWKFLKFLLKFNKKAPATRKTIASILVAIGDQNAKQSTGPQFDCQLMRDPTNIPRTHGRSGIPKSKKAVDTRTDYSDLLKPYLHLAD